MSSFYDLAINVRYEDIGTALNIYEKGKTIRDCQKKIRDQKKVLENIVSYISSKDYGIEGLSNEKISSYIIESYLSD